MPGACLYSLSSPNPSAAAPSKHPTAGEKKVLLDIARNALVVGALAAGTHPMDLHRATGIARTTIDRIDAPQPDPEWDGHPLDGPA